MARGHEIGLDALTDDEVQPAHERGDEERLGLGHRKVAVPTAVVQRLYDPSPGRWVMPDHDALLLACTAALAEPEPRSAVRALLEEGLAAGALGYAGAPPSPGIHVLHNAPDLTILDVVWAPGSRILPHDHRMWAAIAIYDGREQNDFYRRDGTHVVASGGKELMAGEVM